MLPCDAAAVTPPLSWLGIDKQTDNMGPSSAVSVSPRPGQWLCKAAESATGLFDCMYYLVLSLHGGTDVAPFEFGLINSECKSGAGLYINRPTSQHIVGKYCGAGCSLSCWYISVQDSAPPTHLVTTPHPSLLSRCGGGQCAQSW